MGGIEEYILKGKVGHPLVISLPANPTTGFSWEIERCSPKLKCRELPYRQYGGGLGAGGVQRFKVESLHTGAFVIRLRLKRPWETRVREMRTYRIVVKK